MWYFRRIFNIKQNILEKIFTYRLILSLFYEQEEYREKERLHKLHVRYRNKDWISLRYNNGKKRYVNSQTVVAPIPAFIVKELGITAGDRMKIFSNPEEKTITLVLI